MSKTDFIRKYREKIIILDDQSSELEAEKRKKILRKFRCSFVINKYKGLQMGIKSSLRKFVSNSAWLICLQQDTFIQTETSPISLLEKRLFAINNMGHPVGAVGYQNYVKDAHYHPNSEILKLPSIKNYHGLVFSFYHRINIMCQKLCFPN